MPIADFLKPYTKLLRNNPKKYRTPNKYTLYCSRTGGLIDRKQMLMTVGKELKYFSCINFIMVLDIWLFLFIQFPAILLSIGICIFHLLVFAHWHLLSLFITIYILLVYIFSVSIHSSQTPNFFNCRLQQKACLSFQM